MTSECPWCGRSHPGECPRVKAEEFYPDGNLKRIEFFDAREPAAWPQSAKPSSPVAWTLFYPCGCCEDPNWCQIHKQCHRIMRGLMAQRG